MERIRSVDFLRHFYHGYLLDKYSKNSKHGRCHELVYNQWIRIQSLSLLWLRSYKELVFNYKKRQIANDEGLEKLRKRGELEDRKAKILEIVRDQVHHHPYTIKRALYHHIKIYEKCTTAKYAISSTSSSSSKLHSSKTYI